MSQLFHTNTDLPPSSFLTTHPHYLFSTQQDKTTMDFTGFPLCANGDVLIILSNDNKLQLHSEILKRHSKFFKERITQQNAATLSSTALNKHKESVRWRFDLLDKPELDGEGAGHLVPIVSVLPSDPHFLHDFIRDAHTRCLGPRFFRETT
jgi:hypothetical protein